MKRLPVTAHLSADEVGDRYRHCSDPKEKTRWHLVWRLLRDDALTCERAGPKLARYVRDRWGTGVPGDRLAVPEGARLPAGGAPPAAPQGGRPGRTAEVALTTSNPRRVNCGGRTRPARSSCGARTRRDLG